VGGGGQGRDSVAPEVRRWPTAGGVRSAFIYINGFPKLGLLCFFRPPPGSRRRPEVRRWPSAGGVRPAFIYINGFPKLGLLCFFRPPPAAGALTRCTHSLARCARCGRSFARSLAGRSVAGRLQGGPDDRSAGAASSAVCNRHVAVCAVDGGGVGVQRLRGRACGKGAAVAASLARVFCRSSRAARCVESISRVGAVVRAVRRDAGSFVLRQLRPLYFERGCAPLARGPGGHTRTFSESGAPGVRFPGVERDDALVGVDGVCWFCARGAQRCAALGESGGGTLAAGAGVGRVGRLLAVDAGGGGGSGAPGFRELGGGGRQRGAGVGAGVLVRSARGHVLCRMEVRGTCGEVGGACVRGVHVGGVGHNARCRGGGGELLGVGARDGGHVGVGGSRVRSFDGLRVASAAELRERVG